MNPDIDLTARGFSVKTAYYLVKVCALAYNTPLGSGIAELGLVDAMAVPFDFGELHGFVATLDSYVVLGFRGTDSIATWLADGRIVQVARPPYPGMVHRGFADALDAIWSQLKTRLPQALGKRPLYVTGHSLGGALASLAAYRLAAEGIPVRATYTFGSPRVGNLDFYAGYNVVNYRFVHNNDLVPHVPLEFLLVGVPVADRALFGHPVQGLLHFVYKHVGTLKYLDRNGQLGEGMSDWDQKKEFLANALIRGQGTFEPAAIDDHHIQNYVAAVGQALQSTMPAPAPVMVAAPAQTQAAAEVAEPPPGEQDLQEVSAHEP